MKRLQIKRVAANADGMFGVIIEQVQDFGSDAFALTLERPWLQNKRNISCIPNGLYLCRRITSPRFGNTFHMA